MKKIVFLLLAGLALSMVGCKSNTYSNLRKKEKKLIKNYINRKGLNIIKSEPSESYVWGEKDYYQVEGYDELYFHLRRRGDSIKVVAKDVIVTRYKKFDLTENPDTLSYWTTMEQAHPYEFQYADLNTCEAVGWHEAVRLMKYSDSECEIIVPSKQGFEADEMSVTPYVYIMKINVKP